MAAYSVEGLVEESSLRKALTTAGLGIACFGFPLAFMHPFAGAGLVIIGSALYFKEIAQLDSHTESLDATAAPDEWVPPSRVDSEQMYVRF
jgi:hypothetical protein